MKMILNRTQTVVALLIMALTGTVFAAISTSRAKSALSAVRSQVSADEDRAATWEEILELEPLSEELDKGIDADPSVIRKSVDGLLNAEKPIDKQRLIKLRDALQAWVDDAKKDAIPDKAPDADPNVIGGQGLRLGSPDGDADKADDEDKAESEDDEDADDADEDEDVEAARKKLEGGDADEDDDDEEEEEGVDAELAEAVAAAVEDLNDWLKRTGGSRVWSKVLPLSDIADAADDPVSAEPEDIQQFIAQINAELTQVDRTNFVALRRALQQLQAEIEYPVEENCAKLARQAISNFREVDAWRLSTARTQLQQSLNALNNFLATGAEEKQEGWGEFLELENLNESLEGGGTPVVSTLVKSFNQFNSGESGLELSQFTSVRDNLEVYLELLQYSETASGRLAQGRNELKSTVDTLDNFLRTTTKEKEESWKEFLEWEILAAQLEEDIPDASELRKVATKFAADENGLDLPVYRNVARAIAKVQELTRLHTSTNAEDIYRRRIERLAQTLERHELDPTNTTAADLVKELKWMQATGYASEIASCIRGGYNKPNFFASVSGAFVTNLLNDTITDATPVNRCFEGSRLRGCARTNAQVTAQLQPSQNGVILDVLVNGQTVSTSTAQQRKVYVSSRGNTSISASMRLYASLDGLYADRAVAKTSTCACNTGVCIDRRCQLGNRLITRIANRKFEQSRCKAQSMQSKEAKDTITQRMNDQARDMISQSNQRLQDLRARLNGRLAEFEQLEQLRPENLSIRSTTEKILAQGKLTAGRYLGAPSDPPQVGTDSDLTLQVHQSAINNALASVLGGIKLDNAMMVEMMEKNGMPIPDELKVKPADDEPTPADEDDADADEEDEDEDEVDDESWSITFDTQQPATIDFSEGKIRVGIRGRRFEQGAQEVNEPLEIAAVYRLRKDSQGHLEARLVGEVDIVFVKSPGRLNTRQLAYKTFIKRKIGPLFKRTFSTDDLPDGELKEQVRSLKIDEIEATRGWLAIAMSLEGLADTFQFSMN